MVLVQRIGRGVGTSIGLDQEAHAHRKEKKRTAEMEATASHPNDFKVSTQVSDTKNLGLASIAPEDSRTDEFSTKGETLESYDCPNTQNGPKDKSRGFVATYALDLRACNVDQTAFRDFLYGFVRETSNQRTPFNVLNLSIALGVLSHTAAFGPSPTLHFAATAGHLTVEAGKKLYVNKKTNGYLERVNAT